MAGCSYVIILGLFLFNIFLIARGRYTCCQSVVQYYTAKTTVPASWWTGPHDHTVVRSRYVQRCHCCPGYSGSSCRTPICNPPCKNGGHCTSPGHCSCVGPYHGTTCENYVSPCTYKKVCFPGVCEHSGHCRCVAGFQGATCQQMAKPDITTAFSLLTNTDKELFNNTDMFKVHTSVQKKNESNFIWVPKEATKDLVNDISVYFEAFYQPTNLLHTPSYIETYEIGIIYGEIQFELYKPAKGTSYTRINQTAIQCPDQPSSDSPEESVFYCNVTVTDFTWDLQHDHRLMITDSVTNGGYRRVINTDTHAPYKTEYFLGQQATASMEFKFDFIDPTHCEENSSALCEDKSALSTDQDISQSKPFTLSCNGWSDDLSGVSSYTYHIFNLTTDSYGDLTEESPQSPLIFYSRNVLSNATSVCPPFTFYPPSSGMYSILLGVADQAHNTKYARRIVLFDNVSSIALNNDNSSRLYVSSATIQAGHAMVTEENVTVFGVSMVVVWENHFINHLHTTRKFLNRVKPFKEQILLGIRRVYVTPNLDDHEGKRNVNAIPNVNGIVQAEICYERYISDNLTSTKEPPSSWENVTTLLQERHTLHVVGSDGDYLRIWVRVHDIMGNTEVDATYISIDSSPPMVLNAMLSKNVNGTFPFTSRIYLRTADYDSGINSMHWTISSNLTTCDVYKQGLLVGNRTTTFGKGDYCTPLGDCFNYDHYIDVNNCWFVPPDHELYTAIVDVHIDVYNMGMFKSSTTLQVSNLMTLQGMEECQRIKEVTFGIKNIMYTFARKWLLSTQQITAFNQSQKLLLCSSI